MPGLAAAGFKPAVYTNFTTLAHRRMILEYHVEYRAMLKATMAPPNKPCASILANWKRTPLRACFVGNACSDSDEARQAGCSRIEGRRRAASQSSVPGANKAIGKTGSMVLPEIKRFLYGCFIFELDIGSIQQAGNCRLGLSVIGSAGVLLAAKKRGLIQFVRPILDAFGTNGYHFSDDLIRAIVLRAGEL